MDEAPIRLCCFTRHWGVQCPDGKVMCDYCFERVEVWELTLEDGVPVNICQKCEPLEP